MSLLSQNRVYLDHNATSPAPSSVIDAVADAMRVIGNASAQHGHGRGAARLIADAREAVGMAMGQCAQDVIFTAVLPAEAVGWDSDAIESQAFAYLAVRVLRGLPNSFPTTTGVPKAVVGGRIAKPDR